MPTASASAARSGVSSDCSISRQACPTACAWRASSGGWSGRQRRQARKPAASAAAQLSWKLGGVSVAFGAADDASHPTAWQGPLRIATGGAPACTVGDEVAIVEAPVMLGNGILYVPTYSGSNSRLYAVDTGTCRVLWRSGRFSGPASYRDGRFVIGGRPVPLDSKCRPAGMARNGR